MARPIKIFLGIVAALLLLIVVALGAAVALFDPNDYRDQLGKLVKDKTGRDLAIGDIGLTVFPWLRAELKDVSLSNAPGFGDQPFAKVGEASVGVKLLPLLKDRQVQVSSVKLDGLLLNLTKNAEGKTNWEGLTGEDDPNKPDEPEQDDKGSGIKLEDIDIGGIEITKAAINYRDEQAKQAYLVDEFNLDIGAMSPGDPFDIETSLKAVLEAQKLNTELKFSAHVVPDLKTQQVKIEKLKLDAKAKGAALEGEAKLSGEAHGNLQTQLFEITDLKLDGKGKNASLEGDAQIQGGKVTADLKNQLFQIAGLKLDGKASGAALPGGSQTLALTASDLRFDQAKGVADIKGLLLKAAGLEASSEIHAENVMGDVPRFSGPLKVKPFNARELLAKFSKEPLVTADPKALTDVALDARLDGTSKSIKLSDLVLKLDQTTATGHFAVRDFASMALAFGLKIDQIDADRYLAPKPPKDATRPADKKAPASDINKTEIPVDMLDGLDVDGTLDIGKLKISGVDMSEVKLKIAGPKGAAKQATIDARLYGGHVTANTRIVPGARPSYAVKTSIQSITLGPLLKDFVGYDKLSGLGSIDLDVTTAGKTVGDARKALNGDMSLSFKNGAIKGFNLGELIRRGQSMIKGTPYAPSTEPLETDFAVINFGGKFTNGVLRSDSLDARNPLLRVGGEGQIDIANETFDYTAKPTVVESSKGQGGKGLEELGGLTIPVRLTGTFTNPKYKVELGEVLKTEAKARLKEELKVKEDELKEKYKIDEKKEELKQKLNEKLGGGLESLFGRKKKAAEPAPEPAPAPAEAPPATTEEPKKEEGAPATP